MRPLMMRSPVTARWLATGAAIIGTLILLRLINGGLAAQPASATIASVASLDAVTGTAGGPGMDVLQRFHWAVAYLDHAQRLGVYMQWVCPDGLRVGSRPESHTPDIMGTTCEPWMARPVIALLHELLLPGTAKALEWSSGSSTAWLLLGHVQHLTSIEHHAGWAQEVRRRLEAAFGHDYLQERWAFHHIPPSPPDSPEMEAAEVFADYAAAAFLDPATHAGTFDFISIDGRARVACLPKALQLLKPVGGVLVLDNAERPYYQPGIDLVPRHWARYEFHTPVDTTVVWVSCQPGAC